MIGQPVTIGPFSKGLNNSAGMGDFIDNKELFDLVNLEVDTEGSLANRPAIHVQTTSGFDSTNIRILGTWLPSNGRIFLIVASNTGVHVVDSTTGVLVYTIPNFVAGACIQYTNNLWLVASPAGTSVGGYISIGPSVSDVPVWNAVAAMPRGEAIVLYKSRLFVASGVNSTTNTSRLYYSDATTQATWPGFIDIEPGNGQKLVYMCALNNDILLFKEHSTFRYGYTANPDFAEVSKISDTIGTPSVACAATYDNNNVYVLHDNSVYELYNFTYAKISNPVDLVQELDGTLYARDLYALSLYRNRLFVRFFARLYVYNLHTKTWSRWETDRKFSRIVVLPTAAVGLDRAYATSASSSDPNKLYYFIDNRVAGVGTAESFKCSLVSKMYDFDIGTQFKVLGWWALLIATSGNVKASINVPNINQNLTWDELGAYTWDQAASIPILWENNTDASFEQIIAPTLGGYARKSLKFPKKLRFKQAYWKIEADAVSNDISNSSVRIFNIIAFIGDRQRVVKETT